MGKVKPAEKIVGEHNLNCIITTAPGVSRGYCRDRQKSTNVTLATAVATAMGGPGGRRSAAGPLPGDLRLRAVAAAGARRARPDAALPRLPRPAVRAGPLAAAGAGGRRGAAAAAAAALAALVASP